MENQAFESSKDDLGLHLRKGTGKKIAIICALLVIHQSGDVTFVKQVMLWTSTGTIVFRLLT